MPIFESWPWKAKIAKYADSLERLRSGTEEYDDDQWWADFEEAVMAGAFAIRKLFESKKLSYEAQAITIDCKNSPKIPAPLLENGVSLKPSFMDRDKLDRYFDVAVQAQTKVDLQYFLNQVMHSIFFEVEPDEDGDDLVLALCSDHRFQKREEQLGLLWIPLTRIIAVFREIADDDIELGMWHLNHETGVREQIGFRDRKTAVDLGLASYSKDMPVPGSGKIGVWVGQ